MEKNKENTKKGLTKFMGTTFQKYDFFLING